MGFHEEKMKGIALFENTWTTFGTLGGEIGVLVNLLSKNVSLSNFHRLILE